MHGVAEPLAQNVTTRLSRSVWNNWPADAEQRELHKKYCRTARAAKQWNSCAALPARRSKTGTALPLYVKQQVLQNDRACTTTQNNEACITTGGTHARRCRTFGEEQ